MHSSKSFAFARCNNTWRQFKKPSKSVKSDNYASTVLSLAPRSATNISTKLSNHLFKECFFCITKPINHAFTSFVKHRWINQSHYLFPEPVCPKRKSIHQNRLIQSTIILKYNVSFFAFSPFFDKVLVFMFYLDYTVFKNKSQHAND